MNRMRGSSPPRLSQVQRRVLEGCRRAASPAELFESIQAALQPYVPADRWCAMTLDPATALPTGGVHDYGLSPQGARRLLSLEFAGADDANKLADLARAKLAVRTLSGATRGRPQSSARFREVLAGEGISHELRAVFRDGAGPWAALVLLRAEGARDFGADEVSLLHGLNATITTALRRLLLLAQANARDDPSAPGLLLLGRHGENRRHLELKHASASAAHWVSQIADTAVGQLPYALHSVALSACARGHATARVRTRAGRWLTAYAECAPGEGDEVSLILQPSRPHEIAQVLCGAYGLTSREAEVARLVAAGHSNEEIAKLLFVSRYTVEDHLKNCYGKLRVRGRSELVSRLFFDEYLPRTTAAAVLDAAGWFAQSVAYRG